MAKRIVGNILLILGLNGIARAGPGWITTCQYSHSRSDDPIVFPQQPGKSHLHDFVGSSSTDAFSTFESLRVSNTTCAMDGDTSAYWTPAAYKNGVRILPNATSKNALFYYRRGSVSSSTTISTIPEGLKMVIGNGHATSPSQNTELSNGSIFFKCGPGSGTHLSSPPSQCSSGVMSVSVIFPNCWDGVHFDSADHRSHMAYPSGGRCPISHPVAIPRLESYWRYNVGTATIGKIDFSSGPYYTIHQDFFNAWNPTELQRFVTNCLNAFVNCGVNPQ